MFLEKVCLEAEANAQHVGVPAFLNDDIFDHSTTRGIDLNSDCPGSPAQRTHLRKQRTGSYAQHTVNEGAAEHGTTGKGLENLTSSE